MIWTILANLQVIMGVVADIEKVVGSIVKQSPPIPSLDQVTVILDAVRKLLDAGIIKIDGIDDASLSAKLLELEKLLSQGAYELLKQVVRMQAPSTEVVINHPDVKVVTPVESDAVAVSK